jgi:hypothetical protein
MNFPILIGLLILLGSFAGALVQATIESYGVGKMASYLQTSDAIPESTKAASSTISFASSNTAPATATCRPPTATTSPAYSITGCFSANPKAASAGIRENGKRHAVEAPFVECLLVPHQYALTVASNSKNEQSTASDRPHSVRLLPWAICQHSTHDPL